MVPVKSSRDQRAEATRRRMLAAAYDLFTEQGYRATTMQAIADRAQVAVQTVYFTFRNKDRLLQEVLDRAVVGDDHTPPPLQDWYRAAVTESDPVAALGYVVTGLASICRRVAPLMPVFHSVAGDPAGAVFAQSEQLRAEGFRELASALRTGNRFRRGMTLDKAVDLLFVLASPEIYREFVLVRGWSERAWIDWTAAALVRDLYDS